MAKKILITVIVLSAFQDKFDHKTQYPVGTELQVDEERAKDLVNRKLARVKETGKVPEEPKRLQPGRRKINCVMRRFLPSSSVGDRPAPRGCTSTPDERKVTTI